VSERGFSKGLPPAVLEAEKSHNRLWARRRSQDADIMLCPIPKVSEPWE
jgi:hypothetical protein